MRRDGHLELNNYFCLASGCHVGTGSVKLSGMDEIWGATGDERKELTGPSSKGGPLGPILRPCKSGGVGLCRKYHSVAATQNGSYAAAIPKQAVASPPARYVRSTLPLEPSVGTPPLDFNF